MVISPMKIKGDEPRHGEFMAMSRDRRPQFGDAFFCSPRFGAGEETKEDPALLAKHAREVVEFEVGTPTTKIGARARQLVELLAVPDDPMEYEQGPQRDDFVVGGVLAGYEHKSGDGDFENQIEFDAEVTNEARSLAGYLGCLLLDGPASPLAPAAERQGVFLAPRAEVP